MRYTGLHRQLISWLTLCAVLMGVLAPTVSHALQSERARLDWIEVCSAQGDRWVSADGSVKRSPMSGLGHVFEHCPYCALHAVDWAPTPALLAWEHESLYFEVPRLFLLAPHTLHAWRSAQPRGPPVWS